MEKEDSAQMRANKSTTGKRKPRGYWTKDRSLKAAADCSSLSEFHRLNRGAAHAARVGGYMDEVRSITHKGRFYNGYWNYDRSKEASLLYKTRTKFQQGSPSAYQAAMKNNWLDDFFGVETNGRKKNKYWTIERSIEMAELCTSRSELKSVSVSAYRKLRVNGLLDTACSHMIRMKRNPDTIYIWKIVSPISSGNLYKVGITSSELPFMRRCKQVQLSLGVRCEWYKERQTPDARIIENEITKSHEKFIGFSGSGASEILRLNDDELASILSKHLYTDV